ncbi:MAG: glutathione S-transferase family protein, partial [Actinobacteria bacterium]|nr:glutathione S-transferase family protein [Actinomycetota bacterium]
VQVDLSDRPAWLYAKNPAGKGRVPVWEEGDWTLPESAVICEYLEEIYPDPPLWPADAGARAAARLLVFRFEDFSDPYYALRREEPGASELLGLELARLDALLARLPFLTGAAFGLATSRICRGFCVPVTCSGSLSGSGRRSSPGWSGCPSAHRWRSSSRPWRRWPGERAGRHRPRGARRAAGRRDAHDPRRAHPR